MKQELRIVATSDTHSEHHNIEIPDGDLFLHCGDATKKGTAKEIKEFLLWIDSLKFKYKVIISGNHDELFSGNPRLARKMIPDNVIYLQHSETEICGWKIYGDPTVPRRGSAAFSLPKGSQIMRHCRSMIPMDTDILVTHAPPFEILDKNQKNVHAGCEYLRHRVNVVKPKYHFFGHIHDGHGTDELNGTQFFNVAYLNKHSQRVIVVDIEP